MHTEDQPAVGNVPKDLPYNLSGMWRTLKEELEMLECYHFEGNIENVTPEIILQEKKSKDAIKRLIDSIRESANRITTEINLPKEYVLHDPPVLIEVCSFISKDGHRTKDMPSAVREYSRTNVDPENLGHLVKEAPTLKRALANIVGERPYGILFRQYGQDYNKKVFRESRRVPYKVFTAALYVNKDGTVL